MKKVYVIFFMAVFIFSCSRKNNPAKTATIGSVSMPMVNPVSAPLATTATVAETVGTENAAYNALIQSGKTSFEGKCGRCHNLKSPGDYTSDHWVKLVNWMAPKAKLEETEKNNVLSYLQANAKKG